MIPDERELIQSAIDGRRDAFSTLVRRYQNRVFAFIMRMTADREAALDLTQDTFLAAFQNLSGFRQESSLSTWLFQIASNKTINYMKKAERETALPQRYDTASTADRPDQEFEKKAEEKLLLDALKGLPEKQRAVFNLRFFEHLKFHEIARIQKSSVSAVKTNFAEALKKLKARLGTV